MWSAALDVERALLVRHGESEYNRRGLINAEPNDVSPLTAAGRQQAAVLARVLAPESIDLCVTSELRRAIETASILLAGRTVRRVVLPELNDPRAGSLEGGPKADYVRWLGAHGRYAPNPGGGESQIDALRRYLAAYRWMLSRPERTILVVAHGLPLAWAQAALGDRSDRPEVDFDEPGIDFAGQPIRLTKRQLQTAIEVLHPLAARTAEPS